MRKDVKTGMMIGTGLSLLAVVWFSVTQMASSPPKPLRSNFASEEVVTEQAEVSEIIHEPLPQQPAQSTAVAAVEEPQPQVLPPASTVTQKTVIHTVISGQTLSDISKMYYNTTTGWNKIYEANKAKFPKGPDAIKVGIKLIIPE